MLAKVIKSQAAAAFAVAPLSVPEIGEKRSPVEGIGAFAFPDLNNSNSGGQSGEMIGEYVSVPSIEEVLQTAREEAEQIVAQAKEHSMSVEESLRAQAIQEARIQIEAENEALIAGMRGKLTETIAQISALSDEVISRVENDVVELALQIAKKIVTREVMFDRDIALTLVKVSLKKLHSRAVAEVRLHPEDFAYVQTHRGRIDFPGSLEIVEDRTISPGGCLIHTDTGDIDARIESQFEEISFGLLGS